MFRGAALSQKGFCLLTSLFISAKEHPEATKGSASSPISGRDFHQGKKGLCYYKMQRWASRQCVVFVIVSLD